MSRRDAITRGLVPVWADALRLGFGTLTSLPVPAPRLADKARAGWAMTFAPIVGAVLGGLVVALVEVLAGGYQGILVGFIVVGALALLTRGMHLDGLADAADGLGAAKSGASDPARGLEVMRRGDVGPFGVVTVVVVLGMQAAAIGELLALGKGLTALVLALVVSRLILPVLCLRGVPAARADGLGPLVASSVGGVQALISLLLGLAAVALLGAAITMDAAQHTLDAGVTLAAAAGGICVGVLFALRCIKAFGGITGDVLGACVELAFTAVLVIAALALA